jgi:hypothetical protein
MAGPDQRVTMNDRENCQPWCTPIAHVRSIDFSGPYQRQITGDPGATNGGRVQLEDRPRIDDRRPRRDLRPASTATPQSDCSRDWTCRVSPEAARPP